MNGNPCVAALDNEPAPARVSAQANAGSQCSTTDPRQRG